MTSIDMLLASPEVEMMAADAKMTSIDVFLAFPDV